jgi:hypothetical protein
VRTEWYEVLTLFRKFFLANVLISIESFSLSATAYVDVLYFDIPVSRVYEFIFDFDRVKALD